MVWSRFLTEVLVNAANLHAGGGVAVATSVIAAISAVPEDARRVNVLASTQVDRNLASLSIDTSQFSSYRRFDMNGVKAGFRSLPVRWDEIDVVLNVFGPMYHLRSTWGSVCGVAQPHIAFPGNLFEQQMGTMARLRVRAKYGVQALTLIAPRCLYVEQEQVRQGLMGWRILRHKRIDVIPNVVDSIYGRPEQWKYVDLPRRTAQIRLGVVSRDYPHKNLRILPAVKALIEERLGQTVEILVTLTAEEWASAPAAMRAKLTNVGPLTLAQGPNFYRSLDAVVFPTLMECFSATPIEARAMGTPIFASDLSVIRETVGDYATYVDPLDPSSIADAIVQHFRDYPGAVATPESYLPATSSADRARAMLHICDEVASSRGTRRSGLILGSKSVARSVARTGELARVARKRISRFERS